MATKSRISAVAIALAIAGPAAAQQSPQIDFKSVGRGAPVMVDAATLPVVGAAYQRVGGPGRPPDPNTPRPFIGSAPPGGGPTKRLVSVFRIDAVVEILYEVGWESSVADADFVELITANAERRLKARLGM